MHSVSVVTSDTAPGDATLAIDERPAAAVIDDWATAYERADDAEQRLVDAALRCIARWGVRKTSIDDIAREAGVSRATVYRVFPGGKERLLEALVCLEAGRILHGYAADVAAAESLEELLVAGLAALWRVADDDVLAAVIRHEPELVLPHFAFHQLDRVLDLADALCRPHLERFLPPEQVRSAAELLTRVGLSFAFRPATWVDPHDAASIHRLVRTYLLPALTPATTRSAQETS